MGAPSRSLPHCWSSHAKCPRVPMCKRAAIQAKGIVVLDRNSQATRTFPGSPLRLSTMAVPRCRSSGVPHCARSQEREPGSFHAMN